MGGRTRVATILSAQYLSCAVPGRDGAVAAVWAKAAWVGGLAAFACAAILSAGVPLGRMVFAAFALALGVTIIVSVQAARSGAGARLLGPWFLVAAAFVLFFLVPSRGHLYGYDVFHNFGAIKLFEQFRWPFYDDVNLSYTLAYVSDYPMLYYSVLVGAGPTGLSAGTAAWLWPGLWTLASVPLAYAVGRACAWFVDVPEHVGGAVGGVFLLVAVVQNGTHFHTWFVQESLGFTLFLLCAFLSLRALRLPDWRMAALLVPCYVALGLSHALSSFMGLCLVLVLLITVPWAWRLLRARGRGPAPQKSVITTMIVIQVGLWLYLIPSFLKQNAIAVVQALERYGLARLAYAKGGLTRLSTTQQLVAYGTYAVLAVLGVWVAVEAYRFLRRRASPPHANILAFVLPITGFAFAVMALGRLTLFLGGSYLDPRRVLTFLWPFLFAGVAFFMLEGTHRKAVAFTVLLIGFAGTQVLSAPADQFGYGGPDYGHDEIRFLTTVPERETVIWMEHIDPTQQAFGDQTTFELALGLQGRLVLIEGSPFAGQYPAVANGMPIWFFLRSENEFAVPNGYGQEIIAPPTPFPGPSDGFPVRGFDAGEIWGHYVPPPRP